MPKLTITMTAAEMFALDLIAFDKQEWADNVLTERARVAIEELKPTPEWLQAAIAAGSTVDAEILLKGKELGLFKTAKQRHEEFLASSVASSVHPAE